MSKFLLTSILIFLRALTCAQVTPSFEETISLASVASPQISPDGKHVLFQKKTTDWEANQFHTEIWISKNGTQPTQLTSSPGKGSTRSQWSPNGKYIAYLANEDGTSQIQLTRLEGGGTIQITHTKRNIEGFSWAPGGNKIMFAQRREVSNWKKQREKQYGRLHFSDDTLNVMQLWLLDIDPENIFDEEALVQNISKPMQLLPDHVFHINHAIWSPDGKHIVLGHQPDPIINTFMKADISLMHVKSMKLTTLVANASFDGPIAWSPNGKSILYVTHGDNTTSNYYANSLYYRIDLDGRNNVRLAADFDEYLEKLTWTSRGIYGLAHQKTEHMLFRIDPNDGTVCAALNQPDRLYDFSFSTNGQFLSFTGSTDESLIEVYLINIHTQDSKIVTNNSHQISQWYTIRHEIIAWTSDDGQIIEGVLQKPKDFDPDKKYPLLVILHGGPVGLSTPSQSKSYIFPTQQWLDKGVLIFRPNYRGSAGYGGAFRGLNVGHWGEGESRDILKGIAYLEARENIDDEKIAVLGSSYGGYIANYLNTYSDKFCAISVNAAISDLSTTYATTDIYPWVKQYMGGIPWEVPEAYDRSSPINYISNAKTPTLIQHGSNDGRIPVANARILYRALTDHSIEAKLVVYHGFGHRLNRPKQQLAAMKYNWLWMDKYLWEENIKRPIDESVKL